MVLKTREKLIEAARQLFANKGLENTTMNDIANVSDKGRRTIYTYFKNKREIYNAVIEQESEQLVSQLRDVVAIEDITPLEKLERFLTIRFDIIKSNMSHHTSMLRSFFWRDTRRLERIRELASEKEVEMLNGIIDNGIATGVFDPEQSRYMSSVLLVMWQGVDMAFLHDNFTKIGLHKETFGKNIIKFIINGIKKK